MDSIFSYESKLVQMLLKLADMMIMNILYVLCCLPVFTIGAAQAGLHTGIRQLRDPADDSSCTKAFFRGFANGFGKITLVYSSGFTLTESEGHVSRDITPGGDMRWLTPRDESQKPDSTDSVLFPCVEEFLYRECTRTADHYAYGDLRHRSETGCLLHP